MKKLKIMTAALLAAMTWTGCKNTLEQEAPTTPEEKPVAVRDSVKLTIEAGKSINTKALELDASGEKDRLNAFWSSVDKVYVLNPSGTSIGTLTATPKEDATKATLSGSISTTGLAANQTLTLLFPKATWSYDNQGGRLSTIASDFDFAKATVTITAIATDKITTTSSVTFENQQSIYRFGFRYGTTSGPTIRTKTLLLSSDKNNLAKTVNAIDGSNTYFMEGEHMTITLTDALSQEEANANALIYVAIRNDNKTQDDTFSFTIYDADGATYKGSKTIPSASLSSSFVSAKAVALDRLELLQYSTHVTAAL